MIVQFMRALSLYPVVVNEHGVEELNSRVTSVLNKLRSMGHDPLQQLRSCLDYLDSRVHQLKRDHRKGSWILRNKNPRKVGTLAWYTYMQENTSKIIGFLVSKQFEKMLNTSEDSKDPAL